MLNRLCACRVQQQWGSLAWPVAILHSPSHQSPPQNPHHSPHLTDIVAGLSAMQWLQHRFASTNSSGDSGFYRILQLQPSADQKQIKDSFYKLSKQYHPDINKDDAAALLKFQQIAEAYEVLSNPDTRKNYDLQHGFNAINKSRPSQRRRQFRKFDGMQGSFQDGEFVDNERPPEMRNIQYDLSPERMEKIWARYKERWNREDELEKDAEMMRRKVEFRKKVDERRRNMKNMSPEEKEDFLFKLRMLRTDAYKPGYGTNPTRQSVPGSKQQRAEEQRQQTVVKDRSAPHSHQYGAQSQSEHRQRREQGWLEKEQEKVADNIKLREQLRQSMVEKLEMEEQLLREQEKLQFDMMKKKMQQNSEEQQDTHKQEWQNVVRGAANYRETDDPLLHGFDKSGPDNLTDYLRVSLNRSKKTLEEIRTSRPFTYHQQSVKNGIVTQNTVTVNRGAVISVVLLIGFLLGVDWYFDDPYDKISPNKCDK